MSNEEWKWLQPISKEIFEMKYQFHRENPTQVFKDIAKTISSVEKNEIRKEIEQEFFDSIIEGRFIPAGRIIANAWKGSGITNFMNCFTIGIEDSMNGIFDALKEDANISKVGGGVGFDISPLRPKGSSLSVGGESSGPISFLRIFNASAQTIMTGGSRRAAHIALMDASHPDIEEFIVSKQGDENKALTQFNISVKITDKFIESVEKDLDWDLVWGGKTYRTIKARDLYNKIVENAYKHNEPGMFNIDTVNKYNNGYWAFDINEVNPCGELCQPPYSVCCLGSVNLIAFVRNEFEDGVYFDFDSYKKTIITGIRFLDNTLDISDYPLEKIKNTALNWRRIGLGFTGLGDVFAMMKMRYGSKESKELSEKIAETLRNTSYSASVSLAKEKGPFLSINKSKLSNATFIKMLPDYLQQNIKKHGLRNIGINTTAPAGTISLTMGQNCSSGIEPIFSLYYDRTVRTNGEDDTKTQTIYDYAWLKYIQKQNPDLNAKDLLEGNGNFDKWKEALESIKTVPGFFTTTMNTDAKESIDIQAIFQKYIDHSISKTLNLAPGTTFEEYKDLYMYAYKSGLKGFTSFNPEGSLKGILEYNDPVKEENVDDEYIKRRHAPQRPENLNCDIHEITVKGEKFIVLVGKLQGSLYEIFVDDNSDGEVEIDKHKTGVIRKVSTGRYDLIFENGEETTAVRNLAKEFNATYGSLARFVSMSLRHGTPLQFIVDQLSKSKNFLSFERAVSRVLKKYIKDGEVVMTRDVCPECSNQLVFKEGCVACTSCGWSKCV